MLQTDLLGPFMLVNLRPGRYTVHATDKGRDRTKTVSIARKGSTQAAFYWNVELLEDRLGGSVCPLLNCHGLAPCLFV